MISKIYCDTNHYCRLHPFFITVLPRLLFSRAYFCIYLFLLLFLHTSFTHKRLYFHSNVTNPSITCYNLKLNCYGVLEKVLPGFGGFYTVLKWIPCGSYGSRGLHHLRPTSFKEICKFSSLFVCLSLVTFTKHLDK